MNEAGAQPSPRSSSKALLYARVFALTTLECAVAVRRHTVWVPISWTL